MICILRSDKTLGTLCQFLAWDSNAIPSTVSKMVTELAHRQRLNPWHVKMARGVAVTYFTPT